MIGEFTSSNLSIKQADIPTIVTFTAKGYSNNKGLSTHTFINEPKFNSTSSQLSSEFCDKFNLESFVKKYDTLLIRVYFETENESYGVKSIWIPTNTVNFNIQDNHAYLDFGTIQVE